MPMLYDPAISLFDLNSREDSLFQKALNRNAQSSTVAPGKEPAADQCPLTEQ